MRLPSKILFLGQHADLPVPSISVTPSRVVAPGENVSIHCKVKENLGGCLYLTRAEYTNQKTVDIKEEKHFEEPFLIANVRQSNAGIYWCRYCTCGPSSCSDFSEAAYVNITDPDLDKPSLIMTSSGQNSPGGNVTLKCQGPEEGLAFALLKSGSQIAFQAAEARRDTAEFLLWMLSLKDAASYTCQYHHTSNSFVWSEPSSPVELDFRAKREDGGHTEDDQQRKAKFMIIIWACSAAGLLLLGFLLLFVFVLYRRRKKRSLAKKEDRPASMSLETYAGKDADDIAYAELNHQPLKAKPAAIPVTAQESCVYAPVVKSGTRKGQ
ncbi:T-cell-interacting, activating receptor on myeloid cells protein 1-like isoform X2 [Varanus komodoensis]|uniref:T-cell-interacting, activating receptor on myeloid cells protein 1-like isoform X2 n=1 Tax=Varanus komodoensis TaxID=61221 RepID=UPI001CF77D9B|nr:T-cell-interacting, activating receptor on myeloid cells protein 1-like isoform X2 [Varanus komodoensis]